MPLRLLAIGLPLTILAGALAGLVVFGQLALVDPIWLQVVPVAGAALAYGLAVWMGGSGFIAAFVGGAVFGGLRGEVGGDVTLFLEETGGLLGAVTFVLFGAVMLVPTLDDLSGTVVLYALSVGCASVRECHPPHEHAGRRNLAVLRCRA